MHSPLKDQNLSDPVIAAPMAGGSSTPKLVIAGAMRPPDLLAADIAKVRSATGEFGVNLLAPELTNLWAGSGFRNTTADPAEQVLARPTALP
jgi:nitronate monooxygenase